MEAIELYCPECRKVTRHYIFARDEIPVKAGRVWSLRCDCGAYYSCRTPGRKYDDSVKSALLAARESAKMFWSEDELKECPEEQTKAELKKLHSCDEMLERLVRDAIISYQEMYPRAPNDDCERELKERAEAGNRWLEAHGLNPEVLNWSREEAPQL